ncbi:MAG: tetratricopeptide repeat protein, partial [Rhodoplanes sp.]
MRCAAKITVALVFFFLSGVPTLSSATSAGVDSKTAFAAEDAELVRLGEQAKAAFRRRMEPPPIQITVVDIMLRDQTAIIRDRARESYDAAVDALVAEARESGRAGSVKAALRQLVDTGRAERAEAIFKEMLDRKVAVGSQARLEAAAAARHEVALIELPAALAPVINLPSEARPLPPLGEKAEPAYTRAADLDPDDPWTWVVLAWLTDKTEIFGNALEAARRTDEPKAVIAALHVFGLFRATGGEYPRAERDYDLALAVAREWATGAPESMEAQRYLALCLNRLADALRAQKRFDRAAAAYQEAYAVRHRLAEAQPDDHRRQVDLIASHMNLGALLADQGDTTASNRQFDEAGRLYRALAVQNPFETSYAPTSSGGVGVVLAFAGLLTLVIGLIAL